MSSTHKHVCIATHMNMHIHTPNYKESKEPGVLVHPCSPSTREAEAEGSEVQGHPQLHMETSPGWFKMSNKGTKPEGLRS